MINTFVTQHCMLKTLDGHAKKVGNVNLLCTLWASNVILLCTLWASNVVLLCTLWASNVILLCTLYMITRSRTEKESEEEQ